MRPPRAPLGGAHRLLAGSTTLVVAAGVVCTLVALFVGCTSKDVDLGGAEMSEASSSLLYEDEAGAIANLCDPCAGSGDCPGGSECAALLAPDNNTYCGTLCPLTTECGDDEHCQPGIITADNEVKNICVPNSNTCGAAPPVVINGETLEQCGPLAGPDVKAYCNRCGTPQDCQENGCYAGQWCDTRNNSCYDPPTTCP